MGDFNAADINNLAQAVKENNENIKAKITGTLSDLETDDKRSLVAAVNEVKESVIGFKQALANVLFTKYGITIINPPSAPLQDYINAINAISTAGHPGADAVSSDLIENKVAYAHDGKIIGTLKDLPDKSQSSTVRKTEDAGGIYVGIEPGAYRNRETGYNPEIYIPNSQIVSCMGIQPGHITKGQSFFGINGVAEPGSRAEWQRIDLDIPMTCSSRTVWNVKNYPDGVNAWCSYYDPIKKKNIYPRAPVYNMGTVYNIDTQSTELYFDEVEMDLEYVYDLVPKFAFVQVYLYHDTVNPLHETNYNVNGAAWNTTFTFYPCQINGKYPDFVPYENGKWLLYYHRQWQSGHLLHKFKADLKIDDKGGMKFWVDAMYQQGNGGKFGTNNFVAMNVTKLFLIG